VHIDKKIDEELYEEGILNEVKRRIQVMRKEMGLVESDEIEVSISSEKAIESILERQKKKLAEDVNAAKLHFAQEKDMKEFEIDGRIVRIACKK